MIWNKELTILPGPGAPGDLHRRNAAILFSAPFTRVQSLRQTTEVREKNLPKWSKGLQGLS